MPKASLPQDKIALFLEKNKLFFMLKLVDKNLTTILRSIFFVIEPKLKLMMI